MEGGIHSISSDIPSFLTFGEAYGTVDKVIDSYGSSIPNPLSVSRVPLFRRHACKPCSGVSAGCLAACPGEIASQISNWEERV